MGIIYDIVIGIRVIFDKFLVKTFYVFVFQFQRNHFLNNRKGERVNIWLLTCRRQQ